MISHGSQRTRGVSRWFTAAALAAISAGLLTGTAVLAQTDTDEPLTASGGGVNVKLMPGPDSGSPTVRLPEVFSFDRNHALCRVDTNPEAFLMPTFEMGDVTIDAHSFFMAMEATSIDGYEVATEPDGTRRVTMSGGVDSAAEVVQGDETLGSRTDTEHATYLIEAVDGGAGGGGAGDSFAFTVFFDADEAPLNHAIFGPEFTFTGEMESGEITIVDPARPA